MFPIGEPSAPQSGIREIDIDEDEDDLDDLEETWDERLWGLTEMFPEKMRYGVSSLVNNSLAASSTGFYYARQLTWIAASSFTIMMLPYLIEKERIDMETAQVQQQRQMLLGPTAAVSGGNKKS